jgi:hypothetical protein
VTFTEVVAVAVAHWGLWLPSAVQLCQNVGHGCSMLADWLGQICAAAGKETVELASLHLRCCFCFLLGYNKQAGALPFSIPNKHAPPRNTGMRVSTAKQTTQLSKVYTAYSCCLTTTSRTHQNTQACCACRHAGQRRWGDTSTSCHDLGIVCCQHCHKSGQCSIPCSKDTKVCK